ncbi:MAG: hypothetical protein JOZ77_05335 [Candidatus Eremiobacteraeota bacterium]|nr:hypothetical protein [Candidatus Eremiobacteraeota bacterium]
MDSWRLPSLLLCGVALSSCSGAGSSFSSSNLLPQGHAVRSLVRSAAVTYTYQTVDETGLTTNAVNGINNSSEIVGAAGTGVSGLSVGYSATPPYGSFASITDFGSVATVATSISSSSTTPIIAGYVVGPPQLRGTWGFVIFNGLMSLFKDRKEGTGNGAATEILGINNSDFAVGFYTTGSGGNIPIVIDIPNKKFTGLKPAGMKSGEATGINAVNDVAGWEKTSSQTIGFFERVGSYYTVAYPGAVLTEALAINSSDQIAGYYQDSHGVNHGFILTGPTESPSQQVWQSIDETNAANGTVVTGINDNGDISGYYVDASNVQHGFVGVPN